MTNPAPESASPDGQNPLSSRPPRRYSGLQVLAVVLLTVVLTLALAYWLLNTFLFPDSFTPVSLNQKEQQRLEQKLQTISQAGSEGTKQDRTLEPEPYSESDARREVQFTEKEINALLARNTDLARKVAIDLSAGLASAKILLPLDPDMPFLGGRTLKVTAGLELAMDQGRPQVILKGVSAWGVPLPNAWLGNLKNVDLVAEFGGAGGFWQAVSEGIKEIEVEEKKLRVELKE